MPSSSGRKTSSSTVEENAFPRLLHQRSALPWLIVAIGLLASFAVLAFGVAREASRDLDASWQTLMTRIEWGPLVATAKAFDVVGGVVFSAVVIVIVGLVLLARRGAGVLLIWLAAVLSAKVVSFATKAIVDRPRPGNALVEASTGAYPSGHTTDAAVVALTLALLVTTPSSRARTVAIALASLYAIAMAASRTYLRIHWLTDVGGGLLLGFGAAIAAIAVISMHGLHREPPTESPASAG